jgi:hypothetical protein
VEAAKMKEPNEGARRRKACNDFLMKRSEEMNYYELNLNLKISYFFKVKTVLIC